MTITPETKDWTWVLEQACPQCGYDARAILATDVARRLREQVPVWTEALSSPPARTRPNPSTWSPLEYACHVRDVCTRFDERVHLMVTEDNPQFSNWDQDATAIEDGYDKQEPLAVAAELASAAETMAATFDAVARDQWSREGRRSDGAVFTVETLARYFLHDIVHHGWDVTAGSTDT